MIENGLENLMSMSKTDLKSMSSDSSLPYGVDTSKDDMIRNVSNVMLGVCGDTSNAMLDVLEEEERNVDEVENMS